MCLKQSLSFLALCVSVSSLLIWLQSTPLLQDKPTLTPRRVMAQSVPYVPTPDEVVLKMLRIAGVIKDDVVYDLGSGDGRLVITAAKQFGARGVGVEINPQLIQESNRKASSAGVSDRVKFIEQDLFQADLSEATVVTLYLLPEVNLKLRPKLLRELKPGTRLVSHQFDMKEWKSDRTEVFWGNSSLPHWIHYWIVPAQVAGTWQWTTQTATGEEHYTLQLSQQFQEVSGTVSTDNAQILIAQAKLTGDQLSFKLKPSIQGTGATRQFNGRVSGNTITGSMEILDGKQVDRSDWVAQRQP